ncbi:MAG: TonB-dependent receptor [Bacteroidia bacterium]
MFQKRLNVFLSITLMLISMNAIGQGTLRGRVSSGTDSEALTGATVLLMQGDANFGGARTDVEGSYTIKAKPGSYTLIVRYLGFATDTVDVTLTNEVVVRDIVLYEDAPTELETVNIVAKANKASSASFMKKKMGALSSIDGVSNDLIQRTGDNNVGAALARVSGVTVADGKYVYVRGLGDRYSKTLLNGATIPSLDPDRNAVQLDLFPANLIDRIIIHKTFTPDLPGDFTGGLVDVITRDFPDKFKLKVGYSAGFNTQSSFQDDFLSGNRGGTDWLGFDDGSRGVPESVQNLDAIGWPDLGQYTSLGSQDQWQGLAEQYREATLDFATRDNIAPTAMRSGMNQSLQFSMGNQYKLFGKDLGFIAGLTYNSSYKHAPNSLYGRFKNTSDAASGEISTGLNTLRQLAYTSSEHKVVWGGLMKLSYKISDKNTISVNLMRNQGGSNVASDYAGTFPEDNTTDILNASSIGYTERSMNIVQVEGDHVLGQSKEKGLQLDWIASFSGSRQYDPNLRFFTSQFTPAESPDESPIFNIDLSNYRAPAHFYRDLTQQTNDVRVNATLPFTLGEKAGKIKWGAAYTNANRSFGETRYEYGGLINARQFNGDEQNYLANAAGFDYREYVINGISYPSYATFVLLQNASELQNQYDAEQTFLAGYAMAELPISNRLKAVFGARLETTDMLVRSQDPSKRVGEISEIDPLPMASLIYRFDSTSMNIRAGYARTLARPNFREIAPFESFGFGADFTVYGNPDLQRTLIDNLDLRWEWFPANPGEIVSVSLFHKNFSNPIEKVQVANAQNPEFTWVNVDNAVTYGAEFEFRKNLSFLGKTFKYFQIGGNLSLIRSRVDIDPDSYELITAIDPTRPQRRPLFGQSPWAANGELSYVNPIAGWEFSLSYVNFGRRISTIALDAPDVYELPRGLLNATISKRVLKHFRIRARATNILNPDYKFVQEYNGEAYIFDRQSFGTTYSLGLSYSL